MKKVILLTMLTVVLTGCTIVRIDTDSIDNTINVVLSKNNTLYNQIGKGYKYYVPRGVTYIDSNDFNDRLYSNGNYYYLYIDIIGYYHKKQETYEVDDSLYYSRNIALNNKKGYVLINKKGKKYHIKFLYNYAVIEAYVTEENINEAILNATYILSTIKFNDKVIKLILEEDVLANRTELYDEFTPKEDTESLLKYEKKEE